MNPKAKNKMTLFIMTLFALLIAGSAFFLSQDIAPQTTTVEKTISYDIFKN